MKTFEASKKLQKILAFLLGRKEKRLIISFYTPIAKIVLCFRKPTAGNYYLNHIRHRYRQNFRSCDEKNTDGLFWEQLA